MSDDVKVVGNGNGLSKETIANSVHKPKLLSLCTGYGGLDLATEEYFNAELIGCAEIDKYASIAIDKHFNVKNYGDIKNLVSIDLDVDIITAGYPCQPFSTAGNRKGFDDKRHIWPYIKKIIGNLQPSVVILENVRGHLTLGFKEVLADITELGYDAQWAIVRASDVGAPHRRERVFILAQPSNTNSERRNIRRIATKGNQRESQFESCQCGETFTNTESWRTRNQSFGISQENAGSSCNCRLTSNTDNVKQQGIGNLQRLGRRFNTRAEMQLQRAPNPLDLDEKLNPQFVEYMMGLPKGWVTDLDISRSQQLKMLGNGVVPQQAFHAINLLWHISHLK